MGKGVVTPRVLRRPEAARYLGLPLASFDRLRFRGEGPPVIQLGPRAVGYTLESLDRWIDTRAVQPVP